MSHSVLVRALALSLVLPAGCEEKSTRLTVGNEPAAACELSTTTLANSEWVILKINPDKTEVPDHYARMRFFDEGGKLKVNYNVGSVAAMYTYECTARGEGLLCGEAPKVKDWCQALLVGNATCDAASLRKIEPALTDEEIAKGVAEAEANYKKYKESKDPNEWKSFQFNNNNLGNKLRGLLYVDINKKSCNLKITDNYITIYNGKKIEDSNPVGTNAFVKNTMGELLFKDCKDTANVLAQAAAGFPADPAKATQTIQFGAGDTVHYYLMAPDYQTTPDGCTDSFRTWLNGKPAQAAAAPTVVPGPKGNRTEWYASQAFPAPSATPDGDIYTFEVARTCAGKEPQELVACARAIVR
jgi:hypothetical protein